MTYEESLLGHDEHIVYGTRRHWWTFLRSLIATLIAVTAAAAIGVALTLLGAGALAPFTAVLVLPPLIRLVYDVVRWRGERFFVTNRRILHVGGLLNKYVADSSLTMINDVLLTQSLLGRLLDYGDLEVLTASELGVNRLAKIAHPLAFKAALLDQKWQLDDRAPHGAAPAG